MLVKVIFLFLGLMVLVALIGRALFPSALPRIMQKDKGPAKCPKCGRYLLSRRTCDCRNGAK
ncbi:MAG: hypothetical protein JNK34_11460 [Tabrizicola sp.]|nr:hypothetical protein [Tabrizicola sp.]